MAALLTDWLVNACCAVDMNEKSSRAHTVFRLIIESKDSNGGTRSPVRSSTLYVNSECRVSCLPYTAQHIHLMMTFSLVGTSST